MCVPSCEIGARASVSHGVHDSRDAAKKTVSKSNIVDDAATRK